MEEWTQTEEVDSAEEVSAEEPGYSEDSQGSAEESAESTAGDVTGDGETENPPTVDVGELVELLKGYTEDGKETEEEPETGVDTSVPEVPTAVTDAATVETLAEIRDMLDGMSVSMNSIYTETAAYQTEALAYMEKSNSWLVTIIIALLVLGISVAVIAGLKIADIFFGRMRL